VSAIAEREYLQVVSTNPKDSAGYAEEIHDRPKERLVA